MIGESEELVTASQEGVRTHLHEAQRGRPSARRLFKRHILPAISKMPLADVTPMTKAATEGLPQPEKRSRPVDTAKHRAKKSAGRPIPADPLVVRAIRLALTSSE